MSKQQIVVFKEKHGDRYFIINSPDDFKRICLSIVKERNGFGWYSHLDSQKEPVMPSFSKEDISQLPQEFQSDASKTWSKYERDLRVYKDFQFLINLRNLALEGDGVSAVKFVREMSENEYEGYEVVNPELI